MDIAAEILRIALKGAIKTRIMYNALLSFPQLKEYLEMLVDTGLLEYSREGRKYHTTEKGRSFLTMYNEVGRIIAPKAGDRGAETA